TSRPMDIGNEVVYVSMKIWIVMDDKGVMKSQLAQRTGQLLGRRRDSALHQNRNHQCAGAGQAAFHLDPHKIIRIAQPPFALTVGDVRPLWADDNQHDIGSLYGLLKNCTEILTGWDVVDILEDVLLAKCLHQPIVDAVGHKTTISTTVRDKDTRHILGSPYG